MRSIDRHERLDKHSMSRRESYFPLGWTRRGRSFAEIWRCGWVDLSSEYDEGDEEGVDKEGGGREGGERDEEGHDEDRKLDDGTAPACRSTLAHDMRLEGDPESVRRLGGNVHGQIRRGECRSTGDSRGL